MKTTLFTAVILSGVFAANHIFAASEGTPEREMNVRQGPDSVFGNDVAEIMPQLKGATATNENGRIGNELVFWGYRLANNEPVYFYACANLEGVDCARRSNAICPVKTKVIAQSDRSGRISRFKCDAICSVHPPNGVSTCCRETVEDNPLVVGLVSCR